MTTTQPGDGAVNITVDSTDLTTDGQRNVQQRIVAFQSELALIKRELSAASADYILLNKMFVQELDAHAKARTERDVLALKLTAYGTLLQRVLEVDEVCSGDAYAQLIDDIRAAMSAKTEGQ